MTQRRSAGSLGPEALLLHREWIERVAHALVLGDADADDLGQQVWADVLARPPAREPTNLRAWLRAVLRFKSVDAGRAAGTRARHEAAAARPDRADGDPADVVAKAETLDRVAHAVLELEEPYRTTVLLRWFEDMTPREIAARQGVPVETVRTRLKRAVTQLRARLDAENDGDRRAWCLALLPFVARARAGSVATATAGGIVMGIKAWGAAAVVVLALGATWWMSRPSAPASVAPPAETSASATAVPRERHAAAEPLPPPVDLNACDRDLDLHGVVVATDGSPVAGARVATAEYPWQRASLLNVDVGYQAVPGPDARSAVDGTFALRLRRGEQVALTVSAPGFAPAELLGCQAGERVRVVLGPGGRLVLHCRDEAGAPVVGAKVQLFRFDPVHRNPSGLRETLSDGAGDCVVADLPPGVMVMTRSTHPRLASASDGLYVAAPSSGSAEFTLAFRAGKILRGHVTDAATGAPVAGAQLATSWTFRKVATSATDGGFELAGVNENDFGLWVRAAGYAESTVSLTTSDTYDVALRRGDCVTGRLLAPDGKPVAGALIAATSHGTGGSDRAMHTTSGADGRFVVADLRHDQPHTLTFLGDGLGRYLLDVDPATQEGETIDVGDVALPVARRIEGRVVDTDGNPVPGAEVKLFGFNEDRERLRPGKNFVSTGYGCREERRADDLGRFRFPDLCPGDYDLEVITSDVRTAQTSVALAPDCDKADVEIRLPAGKRFVVDVKDGKGAPAAGITVQVVTRDGWTPSTTTQADGRAEFVVASDVVSANGYSWTNALLSAPPRKVDVGATSATLVVRNAKAVRGRVVDPEGKPFFPSTFLELFEGGRPMSLDPWGRNVLGLHNDGTFEVSVPLDGSIDVVLPPGFGPGDRLLQGEVRGLRPDATDVVLQTRVVPLDREMTVVVLDPDGRPEAGAEVVAYIAPLRPTKPAVTGMNGRAYLTGLPATPVAIYATLPADHPHRTDWIAAMTARASPDAGELELTFTQGRRIAGIVRSPDGAPLAGASVWIYRAQELFTRVESGADGRFAFPAPLAESKSLYVMAWKNPQYGVTWEARLDGVPDTGDLDLTLKPAGR